MVYLVNKENKVDLVDKELLVTVETKDQEG